ncbi:MAG: TonB family protein [Bacteroidales bacterium]
MRSRKTNKANLEKRRFLFFELGMLFALTCVFVAFEWSSTDKQIEIKNGTTELNLDQDIIPITRPKEPEKPKPLPVEKPVETFKVVNNTIKVIDEPIFGSTESGENLGVELGDYTLEKEHVEDEPEVFVRVEEMPTFKGEHSDSFLQWIMNHLQYPQEAVDNGIGGTVSVSFIIDEQGQVTQVKLMRGVHPSIDNEALRVVKASPLWSPGKQRNRAVSVRFTFPITFRLQ